MFISRVALFIVFSSWFHIIKRISGAKSDYFVVFHCFESHPEPIAGLWALILELSRFFIWISLHFKTVEVERYCQNELGTCERKRKKSVTIDPI